jgi:membrane protease YdiL (CAAX protease family)
MQINKLGDALLNNRSAQIGELLVLAAVPLACFMFILPIVGESPIARQSAAWVTNVFMLVLVWLGLRMRGQSWAHFGLVFAMPQRESAIKILWQSLAVFGAALAAFVLGSIVMANIVGIPEGADMSTYNYIYHNLPMLIGALIGVYIVSSFGEEVIYRGFLLTRLEELGSTVNERVLRTFAVLISAVIFGLIHFDWGIMGVGQTAFMGLALAIAYYKVQRNLWVNIIAHGYMDTILIVQMFFVQGSGSAG